MALRPNIILSGQTPNFMQKRMEGFQAGRQNALANLYRDNGAGIAAGDPQALNALAKFDPNAALSIQQTRQGMANDQARLAIQQEQLGIQKANAARQAQAFAAGMTQQERADAAQKLQTDLLGLRYYYDRGDQQGYADAVAKLGLDPGEYAFDTFPQQFIDGFGTIEALQSFQPPAQEAPEYEFKGDQWWQTNAEGGPVAVTDAQQAGFRLATPEEAAQYGASAGQFGPDGRFYPIKPPSGMSLSVGADGTVSFEQGAQGKATIPAGQNAMATGVPRDGEKLAEELSKADAATLEQMSSASVSASQLMSLASQLRIIAPQAGYTGPGGEFVGRVDDLIGVLPGGAGARGAMRSLGMDAQLLFTERTKGAITDREMAMFKAAIPSLNQTKDANSVIADVMEAGAKRVVERDQFYQAWANANGGLQGANGAWAQYIENNPILEQSNEGIAVRQAGDFKPYLDAKTVLDFTPQIIMGMTREQLEAAPIEEMTIDQLLAVDKRLDQLGAANE